MFDRYGDSYDEELDVQTLEDLVNDMKYDKNLFFLPEVSALKQKLFSMFSTSSSLFR